MMLNVLLVGAVALESSKSGLLLKTSQDPVVHDKLPGEGYQPGSPLHEKQQDLLKKGKLTGEQYDDVKVDRAVPPVSTTMRCIINLTIQYFILYTAVAVVRTYNQFTASPARSTLSTLTAACATVNFAPMLSVLFLGTRMRALQLSEGQPDEYDLPQSWVKMAMQCCAWAVLGQTLVVLALPVILGTTPTVSEDGTPEIKTGQPGIVAQIFGVLRWVLMAMLYGGFTTVCVGAFSMEAPKELWPDGQPPVSPAVACTMNLSLQYFAVYLGIAVVQTWEQFSSRTAETRKLSGILQLATNTVNFAPMLCILFIGARMRALQLDPKYGNPQPWAQNCFYLCAYSVLIQLVLVFAVPYFLGGECIKGESEGDITFELPNPSVFFILSAIRYFVMLGLYGGFTAVIVSVFLIEAKEGPTPPVSPTMQCVMNLTVQFFFVYLLLWVLLTLKQIAHTYKVTSYDNTFKVLIETFDAARATVQFCPMLAILFVGTRMRALQITFQKGAPQGYAQQAMFLSTYAVMAQVLMVLLMPLFLGGPPKVDSDGNVISQSGSPVMMYITSTIRYLALIALYGGAITVVVALFYMTPENANGAGSLVPGVEVPVPPSPPTPQ